MAMPNGGHLPWNWIGPAGLAAAVLAAKWSADRRRQRSHTLDFQARQQAEESLRRTEGRLRLLNESLERRVRERTSEAEARSAQLRALALDLVETESRERKRLARLLHDHFQQLVSAAKLKAGVLRRRTEAEADVEQIRQIEVLLEEALDASRSLATELRPPILDDVGLAAAIQWLVRRMQQQYGLSVALSFDPVCEPDNEQVRTVLFECCRELLLNVVKHAGVSTARLTFSVPKPALVQVQITDDGKGFEPGNIAYNRRPEGIFGLLNIQERLSLLGGQIQIVAAPNQGTTVKLLVPAVLKTSSAQRSDTGQAEPAQEIVEGGVPRVRVVVADDHKLFREGLIAMLSQEAYIEVVGAAGDGAEAVELTQRLQPDILIVDVGMPRLNGMQVAAKVSKDVPRTRIIGLSMHERQDMARAMRDAGAMAYCTKGGDLDDLLAVLRNAAMQLSRFERSTVTGNAAPDQS